MCLWARERDVVGLSPVIIVNTRNFSTIWKLVGHGVGFLVVVIIS